MADEEYQEARARAESLLADVSPEPAELAVVLSLIESDDDDSWLTKQLADALRG